MIPKSIVLNGDKQAKCIQDDLWHLAIVSKRSRLKITWKADSCLKINILHKRRSGVKKKKKKVDLRGDGERERQRGVRQKEIKRNLQALKRRIQLMQYWPNETGANPFITVPCISIISKEEHARRRARFTHAHTRSPSYTDTHTGKHSWTQSWGHNARTVWELSNGELRLTWKPHESTTGKHRRNLFDIGNTLLYPLCTHKIH